jgi:LPXTG-motif cell wall-anchored protein
MIHTGSNGTWSKAEDLGENEGFRACDFLWWEDCPPEGFAGGAAEKCWHWDAQKGVHVEELCFDAQNPLTRDLQKWSQEEGAYGPPAPPSAVPVVAPSSAPPKGGGPPLVTPPPSAPGSYPLPSTSTLQASIGLPSTGSTTYLLIGAALLGAAFFVSKRGK